MSQKNKYELLDEGTRFITGIDEINPKLLQEQGSNGKLSQVNRWNKSLLETMKNQQAILANEFNEKIQALEERVSKLERYLNIKEQ